MASPLITPSCPTTKPTAQSKLCYTKGRFVRYCAASTYHSCVHCSGTKETNRPKLPLDNLQKNLITSCFPSIGTDLDHQQPLSAGGLRRQRSEVRILSGAPFDSLILPPFGFPALQA